MDLITYALSRKYTDNSIAGVDGILVGKSAYEIAVLHGFIGTEAQWVIDQQGHPPFIISITTMPYTVVGNWAVWDGAGRVYIDSGVPSRGIPGPNVISIETDVTGIPDGNLLGVSADKVVGVKPVISAYTHTQNIAASVWTIPHNLGQQFVGVRVNDFAGNILIPDVDYTSANIVTLAFFMPVSGTAQIYK